MTEKHDAIRRRAYEIWEREGRPNGRDQEHWFQAERELDSEESASRTRREDIAASREPSDTVPWTATEQRQLRSDEKLPADLTDIIGELSQTLEAIVEAISGDRAPAAQETHQAHASKPPAAMQADDKSTEEASARQAGLGRTNADRQGDFRRARSAP